MISALFAVALVAGSFGCLTAESDLLSCSGVAFVSLSEMEKGECQFIFQASPPKQMDDSLEAQDKLQTCACNLANKGVVWNNLANDEQVSKLIKFIADRLLSLAVDQRTAIFDRYPISSLLKKSQDEIRYNLERGAKSGFLRDRESAIGFVKPACLNIIEKFGRYNLILNNLDAFAGSEMSGEIIKQDSNLGKLYDAYRICKKADY